MTLDFGARSSIPCSISSHAWRSCQSSETLWDRCVIGSNGASSWIIIEWSWRTCRSEHWGKMPRCSLALLVSGFHAAAMSRADQPEQQRKRFAVICDEYPSYAAESLVTILSQARK